MIIVLGSSGFIGKALFDHFQDQEIESIGISSKDIDLSNKTSVRKLVKIFNKEATVVFASSIVREKGDNFENMQSNIGMARYVAEALKISPVKKVIFISSFDVYGNSKKRISESTVTNPQSPYGISKLASEKILQISTDQLLVLRLGGIFGLGQSIKKYGPSSFVAQAFKDNQIDLFGDGKELRDLVFIEDLVRILSHFCFSKTLGTINVSTGRSLSFLSIAQTLQEILPSTIKHTPRTGEKLDIIIDNQLLVKNLPNDFKFTPIKESLKIMVDSKRAKT